MPKRPKTNARPSGRLTFKIQTAKAAHKPDLVTQTELRSVVELYDITQDLAVEIRRRIENGAKTQKGIYTASVRGGLPIAEAHRHREGCDGTDILGLEISYPEGAHA